MAAAARASRLRAALLLGVWTVALAWSAGGCREQPDAASGAASDATREFVVDEPGVIYRCQDRAQGQRVARRLDLVPRSCLASTGIWRQGWPALPERGAWVADLSQAAPGQRVTARATPWRGVLSASFAGWWAEDAALGVVVLARGLLEVDPSSQRERSARELLLRFDDLVPPPQPYKPPKPGAQAPESGSPAPDALKPGTRAPAASAPAEAAPP